jgi:hypothetical protein
MIEFAPVLFDLVVSRLGGYFILIRAVRLLVIRMFGGSFILGGCKCVSFTCCASLVHHFGHNT